MKDIKQLSSIDIAHLVNEFRKVVDGKIENVYQNQKNVYFQIYKSGEEKQFLKIMLPNFIYLTKHKETTPQMPPQFCTILRKNIKGGKILEIKQVELERIIQITFQRKDNTFELFIELFGSGNVVLCNSNKKIIYPLEYQKWKDRTIKGGQKYIFPKKDFSPTSTTKDDINKMLATTEMNSAVTFIAKEIGTGGKFAEIICTDLNISKDDKPTAIDSQKLLNSLTKLVKKDDLNLNKTLDEQLTVITKTIEKDTKDKTITSKKNKFEKILDAQKETVKKQEKIIKDSNAKAELIYENYSEIESILKELNEIKEKYSWKEIKEKLKGHKTIKKINEKTGKIIINID